MKLVLTRLPFRNFIGTLYQEAFREDKKSVFEVYENSRSSKRNDFSSEKINDFEVSALILSLPLNPLFGSFGRLQKLLNTSPQSTSEGYQIQLRLERSFVIASKTDFDSKMTRVAYRCNGNHDARPFLDSFRILWEPSWTSFGAILDLKMIP